MVASKRRVTVDCPRQKPYWLLFVKAELSVTFSTSIQYTWQLSVANDW